MVVDTLSSRRSLADKAYDVVERMIVTLELAPGTVFSETELSDRIGIGRTPLREALQRLSGSHLVVALPRRGMMVSDINVAEYLVLLETRRVLDRLIAVRACSRCTDDQREALRRFSADIRSAAKEGDVDTFLRLDRDSDAVLEAASRNPFAVQSAGPLHAHCRRFWSMYHRTGDLSRSAELHGAILESVAAGVESETVRACDALMDYLEDFTKQAMELV